MRCKLRKLLLFAVLIGLPASAYAASAIWPVAITTMSPLRLIVLGISVDCTWAPGTVVAILGTAGGNGRPVTYSFGSTPAPTGDIVLAFNAATQQEELRIGTNGVARANCGQIENLGVTVTQ